MEDCLQVMIEISIMAESHNFCGTM